MQVQGKGSWLFAPEQPPKKRHPARKEPSLTARLCTLSQPPSQASGVSMPQSSVLC